MTFVFCNKISLKKINENIINICKTNLNFAELKILRSEKKPKKNINVAKIIN